MSRSQKFLLAATTITLFAACGASQGQETKSKTSEKTIPAAEIAACIASSTSKVTTDKIDSEKACTMGIPEAVTVKFFDSGHQGCRPYIIVTAPKGDQTGAVRLLSSHGDGKTYYSSISMRQRALPDRRTGWVYYGGIDGYPETSCQNLDFKLESVICKRSTSFSAEYEPCNDIRIIPPEMFNSVDMAN